MRSKAEIERVILHLNEARVSMAAEGATVDLAMICTLLDLFEWFMRRPSRFDEILRELEAVEAEKQSAARNKTKTVVN